MPEARAATLAAALALAACAAVPAPTERTWSLTEIDGREVAAPDRSTLRVAADGEVTGDAGCNLYRGRAELADGRIVFGPLLATKRACEPEVTRQEAALFDQLQRVASWRMEAGALSLAGPDGRELLRFAERR